MYFDRTYIKSEIMESTRGERGREGARTGNGGEAKAWISQWGGLVVVALS